MSHSELDRLIDRMRQDPALARVIMGDGTLERAVARAREAGYDIDPEEARAAWSATTAGELSDDDLEAVAGGKGDSGSGTSCNRQAGNWGGVVVNANGEGSTPDDWAGPGIPTSGGA